MTIELIGICRRHLIIIIGLVDLFVTREWISIHFKLATFILRPIGHILPIAMMLFVDEAKSKLRSGTRFMHTMVNCLEVCEALLLGSNVRH
jgi:hypothetical protein